MAADSNSETQLLAEHFGYPPVSLLDDIINSINILAEQALNSVEKGLLSVPPKSLGFLDQQPAPPPPSAAAGSKKSKAVPPPPPQPPVVDGEPLLSAEEAQRLEVENGTHQLETLLCASIDRNFDIFELWVMRNILTVRPDERDWIRLSHYEGLDFSAANNVRNRKKKRKKAPTGEEGEAPKDSEGREEAEEEDDEDSDGAAAAPGSDVPTVASVARLRRRLQASQRLNVMLHAERARNATLLGELGAIIRGSGGDGRGGNKNDEGEAGKEKQQPPHHHHHHNHPSLAFLRDKGDLTVSDADTPLTTTTAFTLSQLQALRALSTSLRTMMPDLRKTPATRGDDVGGSGSSGGSDKKSWRADRLEYVESATRKHLENVRGLELGRNGEVRDGEWQAEGRSLAKGEVEGLEKVVAVLGGTGGVGGGGGGHDKGRDDVDGEMDES